ncbi:hypothetical protein [Methanosarcina horonobensis]|uniref:hypothetical protein n=1 Tax=Methanosarcina horonobensis TaxID=418008 RepID=UPI0013018226|nr:hypothetical protein [Methanosarcina horonobensis]
MIEIQPNLSLRLTFAAVLFCLLVSSGRDTAPVPARKISAEPEHSLFFASGFTASL